MDLVYAEDQQLFRLLKADNHAAFRALYQRYWKRCYGLAYQKLGSKEQAEECTQNVFVSLWERRERLEVEEMAGYLLTAIKYQVLKVIESQLTRQKYEVSVQTSFQEADNSLEETLFLQELRRAIELALAQLPDKTRRIYQLSRYEHQSQKEIAAELDLSEKAVEYHISQALKFLRHSLKDFLMVYWLFWLLNQMR